MINIIDVIVYITLVISKRRVRKFDDISQTTGVSFGTIEGISSNSIPSIVSLEQ